MDRQAVSSSNLASVGYDPNSNTLEIQFHSGGIYQYTGVPEYVYEELMSASSLGSFFARSIKNSYPYQQV